MISNLRSTMPAFLFVSVSVALFSAPEPNLDMSLTPVSNREQIEKKLEAPHIGITNDDSLEEVYAKIGKYGHCSQFADEVHDEIVIAI